MRLSFKLLCLLLPATMWLSVSCKKYPEGPGVSFRAKQKRLVNDWQAVHVVNHQTGEDLDDPERRVTFRDDGSFTEKDPEGYIIYEGEWIFNEDKTHLAFSYTFVGETYHREEAILRLKNRELWLATVPDSVVYRLEPVE